MSIGRARTALEARVLEVSENTSLVMLYIGKFDMESSSLHVKLE